MTAIIILAAGASTRMGSPKQLLPYQESNLLQHAIELAIGTGFSPVIVVLGAKANEILPIIQNTNIIIVENKKWHEGLGSSVCIGVTALIKNAPQSKNALIMLCDQPFVTTELLKQLIKNKAITKKKIIASAYENTTGVPVLFDKSFFSELLQLSGHDGAKKLLLKYSDDVATVPFPEGAIDIDTREDYEALLTT